MGIMESLKNKIIINTKFKHRRVYFQNDVHVVFLTNALPDFNTATVNRWRIGVIENKFDVDFSYVNLF